MEMRKALKLQRELLALKRGEIEHFEKSIGEIKDLHTCMVLFTRMCGYNRILAL